jgi:FdhD protein
MTRSQKVPVTGLDTSANRDDAVAAEEPLEIRLGDDPISVTMRTPGDDYELVAGFLYTEGILSKRTDLADLGYCADAKHPELRNIVRATLAPGLAPDVEKARRRAFTSSSCGLCGKGSIESVLSSAPPLGDNIRFPRSLIAGLPERLREAQPTFGKTGGLHAAGLFDAAGTLRCAREDIGRHNAVDKVIGRMFLDGKLPLAGTVLMVSGRASFEIVQKALVARIPALCAVSAPSSLAVSLARDSGMTLVGFLRDGNGNVYSGAERIPG